MSEIKYAAAPLLRPEKPEVAVVITDYDGCLDVYSTEYYENRVKENKEDKLFNPQEQATNWVKEAKAALEKDFFIPATQGVSSTVVDLRSGSNRFTRDLDQYNQENNNNGSSFDNLEKLAEGKGWQFIKLLLPDVIHGKEPGTTMAEGSTLGIPDTYYDEPDYLQTREFVAAFLDKSLEPKDAWDRQAQANFLENPKLYSDLGDEAIKYINEEKGEKQTLERAKFDVGRTLAMKIQLLKANFSDIATRYPNQQVRISFIDDRVDILMAVDAYFRLHPHLLPAGSTLHLFRCDEMHKIHYFDGIDSSLQSSRKLAEMKGIPSDKYTKAIAEVQEFERECKGLINEKSYTAFQQVIQVNEGFLRNFKGSILEAKVEGKNISSILKELEPNLNSNFYRIMDHFSSTDAQVREFSQSYEEATRKLTDLIKVISKEEELDQEKREKGLKLEGTHSTITPPLVAPDTTAPLTKKLQVIGLSDIKTADAITATSRVDSKAQSLTKQNEPDLVSPLPKNLNLEEIAAVEEVKTLLAKDPLLSKVLKKLIEKPITLKKYLEVFGIKIKEFPDDKKAPLMLAMKEISIFLQKNPQQLKILQGLFPKQQLVEKKISPPTNPSVQSKGLTITENIPSPTILTDSGLQSEDFQQEQDEKEIEGARLAAERTNLLADNSVKEQSADFQGQDKDEKGIGPTPLVLEAAEMAVVVADYDGFADAFSKEFLEQLIKEHKNVPPLEISVDVEKMRKALERDFFSLATQGVIPSNVVLCVGSNRQNRRIDEENAANNGNGSCFTTFQTFAEEKGWKFSNFLFPDRANRANSGTAMQKGLEIPEWYYNEEPYQEVRKFIGNFLVEMKEDKESSFTTTALNGQAKKFSKPEDFKLYQQLSGRAREVIKKRREKNPELLQDGIEHDLALKILLLHAHIQHIAEKHPNKKIRFSFGDDRSDIIAIIHAYFLINSDLLPPNSTLHLFHRSKLYSVDYACCIESSEKAHQISLLQSSQPEDRNKTEDISSNKDTPFWNRGGRLVLASVILGGTGYGVYAIEKSLLPAPEADFDFISYIAMMAAICAIAVFAAYVISHQAAKPTAAVPQPDRVETQPLLDARAEQPVVRSDNTLSSSAFAEVKTLKWLLPAVIIGGAAQGLYTFEQTLLPSPQPDVDFIGMISAMVAIAAVAVVLAYGARYLGKVRAEQHHQQEEGAATLGVSH